MPSPAYYNGSVYFPEYNSLCGNPGCCTPRDQYGFDREGCDADGYDRDGDYHAQAADENESTESGLESYSYRPRLIFNGEKPPWYGIEIEVTTDCTRQVVSVAEEMAGKLIYCKEDGSVDGAELVTHPMSYPWAMGNFPWEILPRLQNDCSATTIPDTNGIHIHVSRDGFDTEAHTYRWLKFWYRNPNDVQRIARRRSGNWAAFRPEHRRGQLEHVKTFGKPDYYRGDDPTYSRYSAINTTNEATLEVRVFASTLRPQRAKAALQLVAGTVEYTRQLEASDVAKRHGWDWKAFASWATKTGDYPDLIAENRTRRPL